MGHQVVTRARHKYTIRRPRALQYYYRSQIVNAGDGHVSRETSHRSDISSHLPEEIAKERERLDLFVDLIWVGIIGNLSELFSSIAFRAENPDAGLAFVRPLIFPVVGRPFGLLFFANREGAID